MQIYYSKLRGAIRNGMCIVQGRTPFAQVIVTKLPNTCFARRLID